MMTAMMSICDFWEFLWGYARIEMMLLYDCGRGDTTGIPRAASRTQHPHHACITCITMNHLHQT